MDTPRFVVDINAGGLTRWLRAMGYDTLCLPHVGDGELAAVALREGRVLVTRDSELPRRRDAARGRLRVVLVRDQDVMSQLRQVAGEMGLRMEGRAFTLCLRCNVALRDRARETVKGAVPPYVFQTHRSFKECPGCGRLYWQGTHWERMRLALAGVAGGPEGSAP